jgi:hypothetical protein
MGTSTPYVAPPPPQTSDSGGQTRLTADRPNYVNGQQVTYELDGIAVPRSMALRSLSSGSAVQCPNNDCSGRQVTYKGVKQFAYFRAYADGYSGFIPQNATYLGSGAISSNKLDLPILLQKGQSRYPNDTNLVSLNGASGSLSGEGIAVLNNTGIDAFWNLNMHEFPFIRNITRERISDNSLKTYRDLMERTLATDKCSKFLQKLGIDPNAILKAFDLTRIQGGYSFDNIGYGGLTSNDNNDYRGAGIQINKRHNVSFSTGDLFLLREGINVFLHETIHALGFDDNNMAKLMQEKGLFNDPEGPNKRRYHPRSEFPEGAIYGQSQMSANSFAWGSVFGNNCTPTEAEVKKWLNR